jgi:hypothetical protein
MRLHEHHYDELAFVEEDLKEVHLEAQKRIRPHSIRPLRLQMMRQAPAPSGGAPWKTTLRVRCRQFAGSVEQISVVVQQIALSDTPHGLKGGGFSVLRG